MAMVRTASPVPGVPADAGPGGNLHRPQQRIAGHQLRKIIKNRGHVPNDEAVIKLVWLAISTTEDKRARDRAKEAGLGLGAKRKANGHLLDGGQTTPAGSKPSPHSPSSAPTESTPHITGAPRIRDVEESTEAGCRCSTARPAAMGMP